MAALIFWTVDKSFAKTQASDLLNLPPVMERSLGDPAVQNGAVKNRTLIPRLPKLRRSKSRQNELAPETRQTVASQLLERFWSKHLANSASSELIPLSRERFFRIGLGQLLGKPANDSAGNTWWRVRMGLPKTPEPNYHMVAMTTKDPDKPYRHFALGLRKRGGTNVQADTVLDYRVPWETDQDPTYRDWMNRDKSLQVYANIVPFGDWLYTQTHFRGLSVDMRFLQISREQRLLLETFCQSADQQSYGAFGALHSNCASQGFATLNRLVPIGEEFCQCRPLADLPKKLSRCSARGFQQIERVLVPSQVENIGREASPRSTFRSASNPQALPGIRQIAGVREIN